MYEPLDVFENEIKLAIFEKSFIATGVYSFFNAISNKPKTKHILTITTILIEL